MLAGGGGSWKRAVRAEEGSEEAREEGVVVGRILVDVGIVSIVVVGVGRQGAAIEGTIQDVGILRGPVDVIVFGESCAPRWWS